MASLEELRERLDEIDGQLVDLYEKRMKVCEEVGEYKVKAGRKVFDRQREKEKLADVASRVTGDFNKKGIQELYQQLMSMSRKLQYQQLVEAGALGRLPFIRIDDLDKKSAVRQPHLTALLIKQPSRHHNLRNFSQRAEISGESSVFL